MTHEEFKTLKVGDKVKATRDLIAFGQTRDITKGKIYEVISVGNTSAIRVMTDSGRRLWFNFGIFDRVAEDQAAPKPTAQSNACDCGARVCNTTHAFWCSTREE